MTSLTQESGAPPASTYGETEASSSTAFCAWVQTWQALGVDHPPQQTYEELIRRYSEPHRVYHNLQHLQECLHVHRLVGAACQAPAEIDLALWFHDAIYEPLRSDNELRSAQWLDEVARDSGLGDEMRRRLYDLVMVTRHDGAPVSTDEAVLVDTDLAILGASTERFDEYDQQVRREYQHVPLPVYRLKRR